ncbi:MAG: argininosuccinate lyase [Actinomycetia bacterium]|nr:argininosuccinate lyase [Actinomycetes bacterium]
MKLWSGRFDKETDKTVEEFMSSLSLDKRLYNEDIKVSLAHIKMLSAAELVTAAEAKTISAALLTIKQEIENDDLLFLASDEDIHMAIERVLIEKVGDVGGKLHTARSRNDQVVTDVRLFLKKAIIQIGQNIASLQETLLNLAEQNQDVVLPGYTHLQRAQPISLAHHFLAYISMLERDGKRLIDCYEETDVMPLGSAALAGTALPIDRDLVAKELGFSSISSNSLDAVSDRDFIIQFLGAAAIIMTHVSRLAEEIIIWSSTEFSFIELDDAFTTGSSIMPQKKNPDVAELVRGKSSRVIANLTGILTLLKGLPLAYNRDLQEDKVFLFDTVDTLYACLTSITGVLATLKVNQDRMSESAGGFSVATDFTDYLVKKGVPFRSAHGIVGRLVKWAIDNGKSLAEIDVDDLRQFDENFEADALALADPHASAASRESAGGTGKKSVEKQLKTAGANLSKFKTWLG